MATVYLINDLPSQPAAAIAPDNPAVLEIFFNQGYRVATYAEYVAMMHLLDQREGITPDDDE